MNISVLIGVAIGVLFVWMLLAAITSAIQDWISQMFKWRASMLEESIGNILVDKELTEQFYKHPLIKGLHSNGGKRKPSEIPNKQFASVIFDMLLKAGSKDSIVAQTADTVKAKIEDAKDVINKTADTLEQVSKSVSVYAKLKEKVDILKQTPEDNPPQPAEKSKPGTQKEKQQPNDFRDLSIVLDTLWIDIEEADQNIGEARVRLEGWFDDAMKRLGGAYKRRAQLWSLVVGISLAFALNADSLAIANKLWTDPLVREAIIKQAENFQLPEEGTNGTPQQAAEAYIGELQGLAIPIGWTPDNMPAKYTKDNKPNKNYPNDWALKIGGILLSGIAAAQGAPFWFEIMKKILNFRGSGGGGGSSEPAKKEKDEAKG